MVDDFKIDKLRALRAAKIDPYPYTFNQTHHAEEIIARFSSLEGKPASVAGRIMSMRHMGKLYFLDLLDGSGKIQILVRGDAATPKTMALMEMVDIGDIVGVEGKVAKSTRGEISVDAHAITMLAKSLRSLPEKFHGLSDVEIRYRKRYLDLMVNPEVRNVFMTRAKIVSYLRNFFETRGYVEFETPVLQPTYGGANATPFKTRFNALESDMYLRIADELYLKRLIIGGFEKVFEFGHDFRNEDIDSTHNPEFLQVEFYEAYKDYEDYMKMTEEMLGGLVKSLTGGHELSYQGKTIDFKPPFKKLYWVSELKKITGIDVSEMTDAEAKKVAAQEKLDTKILNAYHVADALFDKYLKDQLWHPTFVLDYPAYMCPLTKDKRGNSMLSERYELYIAGKECGNCYSELTDPIEQRRKFEEQEEERRKGDADAPPADADFIEAIEYGMPPTAGMGIGMDRLIMILTNNISIKEVIAFPAVRPESKKQEAAPKPKEKQKKK